MRFTLAVAFLLSAQAAFGGTIAPYSSGYEIATKAPAVFNPGPRSIHWNDIEVPNVFPSPDPQVFIVPLDTVPETLTYGLGDFRRSTVPADMDIFLPVNSRLLSFAPDHLELTLGYWFHTPAGGGHALSWRIVGEGVIVPEPASWMLLPLAVVMVGSGSRRSARRSQPQ